MNCPYCGHNDSKVIDSRNINESIRRRRQCLSCGARFTTHERLQPASLFIIKKDKRREEFSRDKLLSGIRKACEKRPLPTGAVDKLVDDLEAELYQLGKVEIPSDTVGDMVMEGLKNLDHIAYLRFASVYREFTDISDLKQEVDTLVGSGISVLRPTGQLSLLPNNRAGRLARSRRRRRR